MSELIDQYTIETTWSTRLADDIVLEATQGELPLEMETSILGHIDHINTNKYVETKEIYIKLLTFILKEDTKLPIQTVTRLGHIAGISDPPVAFQWGLLLIKLCRNSGLYTLKTINDKWYILPNFTIDNIAKQKLDKLQYLPPMKQKPINWKNNEMGGWLWENKHIILGHKFNRHDRYVACDVLNKLQSIPWEIDASTYLFEKKTNTKMNHKQFLRVVDQYLGQHFYFVWRYDSRGRSYTSGYDLDLQTDEYGKALVSLHKKELITQLQNLYIAIANHAGKDKLTWKERYDWTARQAIDKIKWKEPILGKKAIRALKDTTEGKPTGYVMSIDATASGLQIMAILSGCKKTAKLVNCIDPHKRYDIYSEVVKLMNKQLKKPNKVSRPIIKEVVMTHYYNSKAKPKLLLTDEQQDVFYKIIDGLLPGPESIMEMINNCWNPEITCNSWIMPDGHTAYIPVIKSIDGTYTDPEFGEIPLTWSQQATSSDFRSLCPNIIHSIDGYVAREMIRNCDFQLTHIHDCFVFNPNYLQKVCQTYRKIMADIASSNLFEDILRQITFDSSITVNKISTDLNIDILNSEYMLS